MSFTRTMLPLLTVLLTMSAVAGIVFANNPTIRQDPTDAVTVCTGTEYATLTHQGVECKGSADTWTNQCTPASSCCNTGQFLKVTPSGLQCVAFTNKASTYTTPICTECCGGGEFATVTTLGLKCVGASCTSDSNCSSPTPGCNTTIGRCVQCTKNTHCTGTNQVCDTGTNKCISCTWDSSYTCSGNNRVKHCRTGGKIVTTKTLSCPSNKTCSGGVCVAQSSCSADSTDISWTVGSNTCSAKRPATNHGSSATITDTTGTTTGSATYSCSSGTWSGPTNTSCGSSCTADSTDISWTVGSSTCAAKRPATAHASNATITDSTSPTTGSATYTCTDGTWGSATNTTCSTCSPVNGGWSSWSPSTSSRSCGSSFTQTRTCTSPSPSCGGSSCTGSSSQSATGTYCSGGKSCVSGSCTNVCSYRAPAWNNPASCQGASSVNCGISIPDQTASCSTGRDTDCSSISCPESTKPTPRTCNGTGTKCASGTCTNGVCDCTPTSTQHRHGVNNCHADHTNTCTTSGNIQRQCATSTPSGDGWSTSSLVCADDSVNTCYERTQTNGQCGSTKYSCSPGTAKNKSSTSVTNGFKWDCYGSNGGTNATGCISCSTGYYKDGSSCEPGVCTPSTGQHRHADTNICHANHAQCVTNFAVAFSCISKSSTCSSGWGSSSYKCPNDYTDKCCWQCATGYHEHPGICHKHTNTCTTSGNIQRKCATSTPSGDGWSSTTAKKCADDSVDTCYQRTQTNGQCGSTKNTCSTGTVTNEGTQTGGFTWECHGSNGGTNATNCSSCSMGYRKETDGTCSIIANPVNGQCNTTANSCITGTYKNTTDPTNGTAWKCKGSNGGADANCLVCDSGYSESGGLCVSACSYNGWTNEGSCVKSKTDSTRASCSASINGKQKQTRTKTPSSPSTCTDTEQWVDCKGRRCVGVVLNPTCVNGECWCSPTIMTWGVGSSACLGTISLTKPGLTSTATTLSHFEHQGSKTYLCTSGGQWGSAPNPNASCVNLCSYSNWTNEGSCVKSRFDSTLAPCSTSGKQKQTRTKTPSSPSLCITTERWIGCTGSCV